MVNIEERCHRSTRTLNEQIFFKSGPEKMLELSVDCIALHGLANAIKAIYAKYFDQRAGKVETTERNDRVETTTPKRVRQT
jgi:hypothetical protein